MNISNLMFILATIIIESQLALVVGQESKQCINIKRYYNQKTDYVFRDVLELSGSNAILHRGTSQKGEGNLITIVDGQSNEVLHSISLDSHFKQMLFCAKKNKLFTVSEDKLVERHLLQFEIVRTYHIPNIVMVQDIPQNQHLLLVLVRDQKAFTFNLTSEESTFYYPIRMEGQKYPIQNLYVKLITLLNFNIYVRGGEEALEIYTDSGQPIKYLFIRDYYKNPHSKEITISDVIGIEGTNLLVLQFHLKEIIIWEVYKESENSIKQREKIRLNIPKYYPFKFHHMRKYSRDYLVVFSSINDISLENNYLEVFVYQITCITDANNPDTMRVTLQLIEAWKNTQSYQSITALSYFPQSQRVFGIMNDEHQSFELLESQQAECDYDNDGIFDSYCRLPRILRFRKWDRNIGIFFLNDGNIMIPNSNYNLLEVRDSQMMEIYNFKVPSLSNSTQQIMRITQQPLKTKRTLQILQESNSINNNKQNDHNINNDNKYLLKDLKNERSRPSRIIQETIKNEEKEKIDENKKGRDLFLWYSEERDFKEQSLFVYDNSSQNVKQYNLQSYFDEVQYKANLSKSLVASYQWNDKIVGCIAFSFVDISNLRNNVNIPSKSQIQDLQNYFLDHNLECYEIDSNDNITKQNLKNDGDQSYVSESLYGDKLTISSCTANYSISSLICKNNNSQILFWSLDNYKKNRKTVHLSQCIESTRIVSVGDFIYFNCINYRTIIQYDIKLDSTKVISKQTSNQLFLIKNASLLITGTPQAPGFQIFDVTRPENSPPLLYIEDKRVCCQDINIDFDEEQNKVAIMSKDALIIVDISPCILDYDACMQCTIQAFISYKEQLSLQYFFTQDNNSETKNINHNPNLISMGDGTKNSPFVKDLQIIELYLKTEVLKNLISGFRLVTLQIFIDSSKINPLNSYFFDWTQVKTEIQILSYIPLTRSESENIDGSNKKDNNENKQNQWEQETKQQIAPKPAYVTLRQKQEIKVKCWNSLVMQSINIICISCENFLDISISYMTNLQLNNVQFLTYDGNDQNNVKDIYNQIFHHKVEKSGRKSSNQNQETVEVKENESQVNEVLIRPIYPTFFLKKINFTTINSLRIERLNIERPILNLVSCSKILLQNMTFDSNVVTSEIITSAQTYLKLASINFTNNIFIYPQSDYDGRQQQDLDSLPRQPITQPQNPQINTNKTTQNFGEGDQQIGTGNVGFVNQPPQYKREYKEQENERNRTIILITFQNIRAKNLLIQSNKFNDHLFFQGFIENQQFSIKTTFYFKNVKFISNIYEIEVLPKVIFIQILLEVFLIAQHDVYMNNITFQENFLQKSEINYELERNDSYYIELSMIKKLIIQNLKIKSEKLAGLIETKMVTTIYINGFTYNDKFIGSHDLIKNTSYNSDEDEDNDTTNTRPLENNTDIQYHSDDDNNNNNNYDDDYGHKKRFLKNKNHIQYNRNNDYLTSKNETFSRKVNRFLMNELTEDEDDGQQDDQGYNEEYQRGSEQENQLVYNPLRMFLNSLFKFQETEELDIQRILISYLHFVNAKVINIYNKERKMKSLSIIDSNFYCIQLTSLQHQIQVNLIYVYAENSNAEILIALNNFTDISLYFNQNSEMKSSAALTIDSLKSHTTFIGSSFLDMYTNSVIGPLSLDVCSLYITSCEFDNNNFIGLKISEEQATSYNQGGFIVAKVDEIFIENCTFSRSFSTRGTILVKSNQDQLKIQMNDIAFSNIFAFSTPGIALYVDSSQSILKMNMTNCLFSEIVSLTSQYTYNLPKSVIYVEKEYSSPCKDNQIFLQSITINDIVTQFYTGDDIHFYNSFQQSLNSYFLLAQIINVSASKININSNRNSKDLLTFLQQIEDFKVSEFKFVQSRDVSTQFIHSTIFSVLHGMIQLEEVRYLCTDNDVDVNYLLLLQEEDRDNLLEAFQLKKNLLYGQQSQVYIKDMIAENILTTKFIHIQECLEVRLDHILFINVQQIIFDQPNRSYLFEKINSSAIFVLKKIHSISIHNLKVMCETDAKKEEAKEEKIPQKPIQKSQPEGINYKSCLGQVLFISESAITLENSIISSYYTPIHNGTAISILNPYRINLIQGNQFLFLKSNAYGSAIYILIAMPVIAQSSNANPYSSIDNTIRITFNKNTFQRNYALKQGGSIFIDNLNPNLTKYLQIILTSNLFYNNSAQLGSSLFYSNVVPQIDQVSNKFKNNQDEIDRATVFSTPHIIKLIQSQEIFPLLNIQQDQNIYKDGKQNNFQIADITIASGQKVPPLRFQLYYINRFSYEKKLARLDLLSFDIPIQNMIQLDLIAKDENWKGVDRSPQMYILRNKDEVKYDVKNNYIEFPNLQFFGPFNTNATLLVSSPLIESEDTLLNVINKNLTFKINIYFRPCNEFEITTKSDFIADKIENNIFQCYKCLDNTFAKDQNICSECPQGAICKQESQMIIQKGFWRESYKSYEVIQCDNEDNNCQGGDGVGNQLCKEGHIGALCEECDLFAEVYPNRYSHNSNFKCQRCDEQSLSYFLIILSHLLTLLISISSIVYNSESIKIKTIKAIYKQQRKNKKWTGSSTNQDNFEQNTENLEQGRIQSGANLKILASYFSIMSSMSNFKFKLPKILPQLSAVVGSPIAISMNAMDCFLVQLPLSKIMPYIYFSFIVKIIFPFLLFVIITLILLSWNCANKYRFQFHYIHTTCLFLFIYLQPDLVYEAINLISCRKIAGTQYILANISYKCNSDFKKYEFGLVYPIFILLIFLFPICLLLKLVRNRSILRKIRFQLRWGILYHEYKDSCYYWEFIKISQKLLIILTISIFNSSQNIQLGVLIIIFLLYLIYLYKMKPFMQKKDNSMEFLSGFTLLFTIVLIFISIQKQIKYYESVIVIICMLFINVFFFLFIVTKIYVEQYELFKQKKPQFLLKCPTIARFLNYLSKKLQSSWRNDTPSTNSIIMSRKMKLKTAVNLSYIQTHTNIHARSELSAAYQNQTNQGSSKIIQDEELSENQDHSQIQIEHIGNQSQNKKQQNNDEIVEFNSFGFGKISKMKKQENNVINSALTLSVSNLDISNNSMCNQFKDKAVPISEFKARNQLPSQNSKHLHQNNAQQKFLVNSFKKGFFNIFTKQIPKLYKKQQQELQKNPNFTIEIGNIQPVQVIEHKNNEKTSDEEVVKI